MKNFNEDLNTYKKMYNKITQDLCCDELNVEAKTILCAIGKKLEKYIENLLMITNVEE